MKKIKEKIKGWFFTDEDFEEYESFATKKELLKYVFSSSERILLLVCITPDIHSERNSRGDDENQQADRTDAAHRCRQQERQLAQDGLGLAVVEHCR